MMGVGLRGHTCPVLELCLLSFSDTGGQIIKAMECYAHMWDENHKQEVGGDTDAVLSPRVALRWLGEWMTAAVSLTECRCACCPVLSLP